MSKHPLITKLGDHGHDIYEWVITIGAVIVVICLGTAAIATLIRMGIENL